MPCQWSKSQTTNSLASIETGKAVVNKQTDHKSHIHISYKDLKFYGCHHHHINQSIICAIYPFQKQIEKKNVSVLKRDIIKCLFKIKNHHKYKLKFVFRKKTRGERDSIKTQMWQWKGATFNPDYLLSSKTPILVFGWLTECYMCIYFFWIEIRFWVYIQNYLIIYALNDWGT